MKIIDVHIHAHNTAPNPETFLKQLEEQGVWGACIYSNMPKEQSLQGRGTDFDTRLKEVLAWTKDYPGRLFPVMWIHPDEENILENVHKAAENGVVAFKFICNNYFIYEEKCLKLIREIASLNKPIFFHTGINFDEFVSSGYNNPLNWEHLINVPNLKFALCHCSWPWVDDCIALFGKFYCNKYLAGSSTKMYIDLTPGTPPVYRKELYEKLFGYTNTVNDRVLWGTDGPAENYHWWQGDWVKRDKKIIEELGISEEIQEKLFYKNILEFLGVEENS